MTTSGSPAGAVVEFRDVVKVYGPGVRALDGVCFGTSRGETVALLGPNGAGKATAIDTMLGLRSPTSGTVRERATRLGGQLSAGQGPEGGFLRRVSVPPDGAASLTRGAASEAPGAVAEGRA